MRPKIALATAFIAAVTIASLSGCSSKPEKAEAMSPVTASASESPSNQVASMDGSPYYLGASSAGMSH